MTAPAEPPAGVDLAREPDFDLGALRVSPSASRVRGPGGEQHVEPRVMEVLVVLARHRGQTVSRDQLIDACWGGRIVSDDAVTRAVAQARALARGVEPAPFAIETVPKVGFRLTAGEAASEPPASPSRQPGFRGRARWIVAAAAAAVVAVAGWGAWTWLRPAPSLPNGRLEVMTFTTRGADPVLREVADDVPEMLIHVLAGSGIQVAPRPITPDSGGGQAELRVAGVVERADDNVVINTQVLDRETGLVLLSGRYVRSAAAAQQSTTDIGGVLAANLQCALEDRAREGKPLSLEALSLLMNACASVFDDSGGAYRMLTATRRLVQVAPRFGNGHALHAIAAALAGQEAPQDSAEAKALAREAKAAAERALKLNPRAAKAYSALALNEGALSDHMHQNWFAAEVYVLKALALDPELPPARNEYSTLLRATGRWNDALSYQRAMSESGDARNAGGGDPRVALTLASKGRMPEAEEQLRRLETSWGRPFTDIRQTILFWWGDPKVALEKLPQMQDAHGMEPEALACMLAYLRAYVQRADAPGRGLPAACDRADKNWRMRMLGREGDVDGVFAAAKGGSYGGLLPFYYPEMRSVRADPRFWDLVRDAGLIDYWRRSGKWPDFCAEPGLPADCRTLATAALARQPSTAAR